MSALGPCTNQLLITNIMTYEIFRTMHQLVAKANAMNAIGIHLYEKNKIVHPPMTFSFAELSVGRTFRLDGALMTKVSPRRALNQQGVKVEVFGKTTVNPVS